MEARLAQAGDRSRSGRLEVRVEHTLQVALDWWEDGDRDAAPPVVPVTAAAGVEVVAAVVDSGAADSVTPAGLLPRRGTQAA